MVINLTISERKGVATLLLAVFIALCLNACGTGPLVGIVYTNVKLPLTRNLNATPVPAGQPQSDRVIEIKEPFTGFGLYARVNSNAIGDIARKNQMVSLYFADQEVFSILGIWKTHRVFLYGENIDGTVSGEDEATP
jgi:(2Fe-2S) ferredoxin